MDRLFLRGPSTSRRMAARRRLFGASFFGLLTAIFVLGAGPSTSGKSASKSAKAKSKREKARELESMAELSEQVGDADKTIALLDELRKVCAQKGPPCDTKDQEILEQIGWLC